MKTTVQRTSNFPAYCRADDSKCGSKLRIDFDYEVEVVGDSKSITKDGEFLIDHIEIHNYFLQEYCNEAAPVRAISCEEMCKRTVLWLTRYFFGYFPDRDSTGNVLSDTFIPAVKKNMTISKIRVRLSAYNEAWVEMEWNKGDIIPVK